MGPDKWKRDFDIHFFRTYLSPNAKAMFPAAVIKFNQILLRQMQETAFTRIHAMWAASTWPGLLEGPPALSTLGYKARQTNGENNFTWHNDAIQGPEQGSWTASRYVHFSSIPMRESYMCQVICDHLFAMTAKQAVTARPSRQSEAAS